MPLLVCPTTLTLDFDASSLVAALCMRIKLSQQTHWKHSTECRCNFTLKIVKNNRVIFMLRPHTSIVLIFWCVTRVEEFIMGQFTTSHYLFQIWYALHLSHISIVLAPMQVPKGLGGLCLVYRPVHSKPTLALCVPPLGSLSLQLPGFP